MSIGLYNYIDKSYFSFRDEVMSVAWILHLSVISVFAEGKLQFPLV